MTPIAEHRSKLTQILVEAPGAVGMTASSFVRAVRDGDPPQVRRVFMRVAEDGMALTCTHCVTGVGGTKVYVDRRGSLRQCLAVEAAFAGVGVKFVASPF